jgi:PAS domain-containing protein
MRTRRYNLSPIDIQRDGMMEWDSDSRPQLLDYLKKLEHRIAELKEREQIWKPTALIDLLIEMIPAPIILLDESADINAANSRAAVVLGSTRDALIGQNLFALTENSELFKENFASTVSSRAKVEFREEKEGVPLRRRYFPIIDETNTIHGVILHMGEDQRSVEL